MELSSFQLMGIEAFHPEIAVITNLMPTHIDYHGSFENYVAAKWNLQKNMTEKDVIVLELQPRPGQGTWLQKPRQGSFHFQRSRKGGRGLFGRWTSQV